MKCTPGVLFLTLILLSPTGRAQERDTLASAEAPLGIVDTVLVVGNTSTETYVILNEMTLTPGTMASMATIEYDRNRIYSLGLFTRVDIWFDTLSTPRTLIIDVSERWHILPLILFGFRDGDPKKVYFGGGFLHNNFRGRNQKLMASITLGYDPAMAFSFYDPLFDRNHRLYFSAGLSFNRIRNRSAAEASKGGDFSEDHYAISASIGKRFSLYETAGILLGYKVVKVSDYQPGRTISPDGRDMFPYVTLSYVRDSRDLAEYASMGSYIQLYGTVNGLGLGTVSFTRFGLDARRYFSFPLDATLVGRIYGSAVAGGEVPPYARAFFGYGERIRGYFKTVFEGDDIVGATVEFRIPILKPRVFHFTSIPLPPEFSYWRFGLSWAFFGDTGMTWFRGEKPGWNSLASGYGTGLDVLLPYSFVARVQYARNDEGQDQFILDLRRPI